MSAKRLLRIFLLSLLALIAIVILVASVSLIYSQDPLPFNLFKLYSFDEKSPEVALHQQISAKGIKTLQVKTSATNISIEFISSDNVELNLEGHFPTAMNDQSSDIIHVERIGDSMVIQLHDNPGNDSIFKFDFHRAEGTLKLQLPRAVQKAYLKSRSGNISVEGGALQRLVLETTSGDGKTIDTKIAALDSRSTSGDLACSGDIQSVSAKSTSGDIAFTLENLDPQVEAHSVSGNVSIEFQAEPDISVDFTTVSGSFTNDASFNHVDFNQHHAHGRLGSGDGALDVSTISGNLDITGP